MSQLFNTSYSWLFKYGYRIIPKRSLVKDAIQELFLVIWNKRDTINEARSVRSYLITSLRRIIFRRLEKQRNRSERNYDYRESFLEDEKNIEQSIISHECSNSQKEQLKIAIEALSKRQRQAIHLKYYRGLSNNEIAEVMSINKQSVYNHVSKAIIKMQNVVEQ
ncbi:RNA polymerase sigma factor [Fodinibius salsisoli]|uniref:Sigma-70 family RNA polymerase sigma factor n=1 Tax=Fodinibius salsisoli TaxID=2820877 RepID=A0ABT3PHD1_9BACT|nr:sigma-70 family RNA polymerase sigma factor [Fodinibius salsisoli]MCW9705329.1 sigma-70 family RNA polymerase sigma factor [Fodinibius salsisoli]